MFSFLIMSRYENGMPFRASVICFYTLRLFWEHLVASNMELCTLLMSSKAEYRAGAICSGDKP